MDFGETVSLDTARFYDAEVPVEYSNVISQDIVAIHGSL
jgi:hypothetical protein